MMYRTTVLLLTALCVAVASSGMAYAETIYEEDFGAPDVAASTASVGWGAWRDVTADDYSNLASSIYVFYPVFDSDGGYLTISSRTTGLAATMEPGDVSVDAIESISYRANNNTTTSLMRMAVRIGSDWYVSADTLAMSAPGSSSDWTNCSEVLTFDWTNANTAWLDLSFTPNVELVPQTTNPTSDLSGNVSEFGLYYCERDGTMRIDDFQINAVPEPMSWVLLLGLGFALLLWKRCV